MEIVLEWLKQLSNAELFEAMHDITSHDPMNRTQLETVLANYSNCLAWRKEANQIVEIITNRKNILATAPTLTVYQFNVGYFKKGSDSSGIHALNFFIKKVNYSNKLKKPHESIWSEMLERSKKTY